MGIQWPNPGSLNFWANAEAIYRERSLLSRIEAILASPFIKSLGGERIQTIQVICLLHLDHKARAEEGWKLEADLLEDCLSHLGQMDQHWSYSEDLELVRQAEETLGLIAKIDDLFKPFAALEGEEDVNTICMDEASDMPE